MRAASSAALGGLLVLLAGHAPAADNQGQKPGRFKVGPLYLTPKLLIKSAGVDTNVFNAASNEVSDTSVVISPTNDFALPIGRRLRLSASGGLDFNYFHKENTQRSTDVFGSGRVELDVGPLTVFGGAGAGRYKQRFSIEVDQRLVRHENHQNAGLLVHIGQKLTATFEGRRQVSTYASGVVIQGSDVRDSLDRRSLFGTLILNLALTDQTSLIGMGEIREDRFLRDPLTAARDARSYIYAGGLEFGSRAIVNGRVLAGIRDYPDTADQAAPAAHVVYIEGGLTMPLFSLGRLGLVASRDVNYAVSRVATSEASLRNSYVFNHYGAELSVGLPLDLIARGSVGFERAHYLLPYIQDGRTLVRQDDVWMYGAALLRAFGTGLRIGASAQWSHRTSNLGGFGYRGLRYGLTAEFTP